jgi:hypothetical protein
MYRLLVLLVLSCLLAACTAGGPRSGSSTEVVTISAAPSGAFLWQYTEFSFEQLRDALIAEQSRMPFSEVHLVAGPGTLTVGQMLQVASLGKRLGVKVYVESDGKLKEFTSG